MDDPSLCSGRCRGEEGVHERSRAKHIFVEEAEAASKGDKGRIGRSKGSATQAHSCSLFCTDDTERDSDLRKPSMSKMFLDECVD